VLNADHGTGADDASDGSLLTPRLRLRRLAASDLDDLVALDADAEVMHHITGGVPTSREEIELDHLPAFLRWNTPGSSYGFWAAQDRSTNAFSGWFHLRPAPAAPPGEPELGFRLTRGTWGRGLATEGSVALIEHAFRVAGAVRVVAETMAVHTASRRVMEKAGMHLVRAFHQPWPFPIEGDEHGDVEYAITREEWRRWRRRRAGSGLPR